MKRIITFSLLGLLLPAAARAQAMAREASRGTTFTVIVENISTEATLKLSNGSTAPAPTAPVLYLVHRKANPIFTTGSRDRGLGLENLAEQGDPTGLAKALENAEGIVSVVAVSEKRAPPCRDRSRRARRTASASSRSRVSDSRWR